MVDPFETLEHADLGAVDTPLPAAEVRARGDRMRRRRWAWRAVAAAAAVAVVTTGGIAVGGNLSGGPAPVPPASQGPQPEPPEPGPTSETGRPEVGFTPRTQIPNTFPLVVGYPQDSSSETSLVGPGRDVSFDDLTACGTTYDGAADRTDRLAVRFQGPEDYRGRELTLYPSSAEAQQKLSSLVGIFESCPKVTDDLGWATIHEVRSVEPGDEGYVVVRRFEFDGAPAIGLELIYAVRVGNAVLLQRTSNEGGGNERAVIAAVEEQTELVAWIAERMCVFSREGCDPAEDADTTFGPRGVAGVELGMPTDSPEVTRVMDVLRADGPCRPLELRDAPAAEGDPIHGFATADDGVVALFGWAGVETPEGIGLGATLEEVRTAYPSAAEFVPGWRVTVPGFPDREYEFGFDDDRLVSMSLSFPEQRCFG